MDLLQNIMTWLYGGYISFFSHVIDSYNDAKHSHDGWLYFDTPSFKDYFYTWNIMLQTIKICILQNESIFVTSNLFIGKKDFPLVWWESEQSRHFNTDVYRIRVISYISELNIERYKFFE